MVLQYIQKFRRSHYGRPFRQVFYQGGSVLRKLLDLLFPSMTVSKKIDTYGPFRMNKEYLFSDFEGWGRGNNAQFHLLVEECRGKRCVLDVGAHIGITTLPIASVISEKGVVISFEPGLKNSNTLKHHIQINDLTNVIVVDKAVGDQDNATVHFMDLSVESGINKILGYGSSDNNIKYPKKKPKGLKEIVRRVQMTTLDTYCKSNDLHPEVIKIDVEGAELRVLKGLRMTIKQLMPVVFLSVHKSLLLSFGDDVDMLSRYVQSLGYRSTDENGVDYTNKNYKSGEYVLRPDTI